MKISILGAAGFIGTNLAIKLAEDKSNVITLVDTVDSFFEPHRKMGLGFNYRIVNFNEKTDFDRLLNGQHVVYHFFSSSNPTKSNLNIPFELRDNVLTTSLFLEACVRQNVHKVVFLSSGGTVYGCEAICPISEDSSTRPITSYGVQKIAIENLLYLYNYTYKLDYRIIRLANPYGPYQRPNGQLGAITTFIYKALKHEPIHVYGDGTVIRDFIYIDDVVSGILNIVNGDIKLVNLGSGKGISIKQILGLIGQTLGIELNIVFDKARTVDVPVNYLDITRYIDLFGNPVTVPLDEGIKMTAAFLDKNYV
ncbi:NAD-dependent epimerase/dehydratase family protein [Oceanispirochaeta crateris]|uniref:NAD-dependent epimerase/dehydratase family protein n=1 Tax=Oceanispirochaeta crateris TaxID=2518645 RepID=A0A5C1QI52_9SPIO|nr:NAD-dependent epimerase/dehydratase family protein [Oceanispirochaeta crateris]QEN06968.1 NAD-dependent epimerase/dehydratase family protein [Oceanispirochaeta crateris]